MNQPAMQQTLPAFDVQQLRADFSQLKQNQPSLYPRNAAAHLGVSEGELLAAHVGEYATRLVDDCQAIVQSLEPLKEVMALTRNDSCVHERKGVYSNGQFFRHGAMAMGMFVNADIDLRLFMQHWHYAFAVREPSKAGERCSVQFFDASGTAVHKVFLTAKSREAAYDHMVAQHLHPQQDEYIAVTPYPAKPADAPEASVDWQALRTTWQNLNDPHDFQPMLRKFKVNRQQALAHAGEDLAYEVDNTAARAMLQHARDSQCGIMVFVGNRGCIQIHSGTVHTLKEYGTWFNVLDPMFNLHLQEQDIARSWVTKKPSADGTITALELFDASGGVIATCFGQRKPGIPELPLWREIIEALPAR